jgi:hypothetical protein
MKNTNVSSKSSKAHRHAVLSAAVAATWANKKVAKARATHNHVRVGGVEYRSVAQAFEALGLPMTRHIAFRLELKAAGRATFNTDDGRHYRFTLVK